MYDPLLQVIHDLDMMETKNFLQPVSEWSPTLVARFQSAVLLEGVGAEHIREQFWSQRHAVRLLPAPQHFPPID